jgi:O-antigen ligase
LADHYRQHTDTVVSRPFFFIAGGLVLIALFGLAVNGSLAGFGLAGPVLLGSALILVSSPRLRLVIATVSLLVMAAAAGWLFARGPNNLLGIEEVGGGGRAMIWEGTWRAITDFWPLGSGLGSFAEAFARYEPREAAGNAYVNHAHNDYLELVLEFGLIIIPVLLGFLMWWGQRVVRIWLAGGGNRWAEAGTVASAAILAHEVVDYPLRTAAISVIFVACLALMTLPLCDAVKQNPLDETDGDPEPNEDQPDRRARQPYNPYESLLR